MAPCPAHIEQVPIQHLALDLGCSYDEGQGGGVEEEGQMELGRGPQGIMGYQWDEVGPGVI